MGYAVGGVEIKKISLGNTEIRKVSVGDTLVFSAGNVVTYYVSSSDVHQEEFDYDESCLNPKTFTPQLEGWTFVGWKKDKTADANVLNSLTMGDDPITLYAVFRQSVTLSYNPNGGIGSMNSESAYRYYNNGTTADAAFTVKSATFTNSGYSTDSWRLNNASSGAIYTPGSTITLSASGTLYAVWTYVGNPYYYIQGHISQINQTWYLTGWSNANGQEGRTWVWPPGQRVSMELSKNDETREGSMTVVSGDVPTNGNKTLSIKMFYPNGSLSILVNDANEKVFTGDEAVTHTWDVSGLSSVVLTLKGTGWGWTGGSISVGCEDVRFY